ncbi:T27G7.15 [Arabidopsis thaliana]|nr:T27G7.15 [Arabidopsis thaliana]
MSVDFSSERVCYVHCSFCTTILAVSVPYASLFTLVTVRCGHCTNLLSLNIGVSLHQTSAPPIHQDLQEHQQFYRKTLIVRLLECLLFAVFCVIYAITKLSESIIFFYFHVAAPEKRQRVPSALQQISSRRKSKGLRACNPEISHHSSKKKKILIVASSTIFNNSWAHFPHIHFGLKLDGNKKGKQLDQSVAGQKSNGYY